MRSHVRVPFEGCTFQHLLLEVQLMESERALPPGVAKLVLQRFRSESECFVRIDCVMRVVLPLRAATMRGA